MSSSQIRIKLKSFDHSLLDHAAKNIRDAINLTGASVRGPIPLPRHIKRFTVNRSPHVNKKSREQFEIRTYSVIIYVDHANMQIMDMLQKMSLSAGVNVKVEV